MGESIEIFGAVAGGNSGSACIKQGTLVTGMVFAVAGSKLGIIRIKNNPKTKRTEKKNKFHFFMGPSYKERYHSSIVYSAMNVTLISFYVIDMKEYGMPPVS